MKDKIKPIALYLPQYHPIPENDEWWGNGFTEWTNVAKAKPLFENHWQPRLPSDLGFYDLRVPEVREAQANLARKYGIHGFCYWHYWFAGRRIIERPFTEVVKSRKPDFPFCVAWANQTWSGRWHGLSNNEILIEQTYPGKEDNTNHFYALLEAFRDTRYMEVNGKKLVFIFRPMEIPEPARFTALWQELAIKEGLKGIHFVGMYMPFDWQSQEYGYDASVPGFFARDNYKINHQDKKYSLLEKLKQKIRSGQNRDDNDIKKLPLIASYEKYLDRYPEQPLGPNQYPWVMTDWDNTPRAGAEGWLFEGATPELFGELCIRAFEATENKSPEEKIVIVRSWNEWAEGNYLEPDQKFGKAYLEAFNKSLSKYLNKVKQNSIT